MKKITPALFKNIILVSLLFLPSLSMAIGQWHTSTVKAVYPLANGSFVLSFNTDSPSCSNSTSPKYYYVTVQENGMTQEGAEKIYSAALAAGMGGKEVQINFEDATSGCYVNRLYLTF